MMPLKGEEHSCQVAPLDILSSLPENLTDDVLSRLSLRDAVRTSILSKKWRYKWCKLPELTIDLANLTSTTSFPELVGDISSISLLFSDVICHLMTFHTGPITRFTLDITRCQDINIDNLTYFLSKNNIQHLVLRFPCSSPSEKQYSLPSSFFACSHLRHLALNNCSVQLPPPPPPEFEGFGRLISLKLHGVTVPSKLLEYIISHSPFLEQLLLHHISMDVQVIEISAVKLRSFTFGGNLRSICLKNVPLLAEISLWEAAEYYMKATRDFDVANFFKSCCALEHLCLSDTLSSQGAAGEVPTRLPFVLQCVKHLSLFLSGFTHINLGSVDVVDRAFCVIRSFPNLQFLEIQVTNPDNDDKLIDAERYSDITFNHLREVNSCCLGDTIREIEFNKLLLSKSPVLLRMKIKVVAPLKESARVEMLAALSKCKPASLAAEVVILNKDESYRVSFV